MKKFLTHPITIIVALFITAIIIMINVTKEVEVSGKCIEKYITWDKYASPDYHVVYRKDDGGIKVDIVSEQEYFTSTIGTRYYWTEVKLK